MTNKDQKRKVATIKLTEFILDADGKIDVSRNRRHGDVYDDARFQLLKANIIELRNMLGGSGLTNPPIVYKDPSIGKYYPLQGNQRTRAWAESVDYDPNAQLQVIVVEGELTPAELARYMDDFGTRPFREVDFFEMVKKSFVEDGMSEPQFAAMAATLLVTSVGRPLSDDRLKEMGFHNLNSPDAKLQAAARKKLVDAKKGTIQKHKDVAFMPDFVHTAWVDRLLNKQVWPSDGEVRELGVRWREETEVPTGGKPSPHYSPMYNRANPGPYFMERWNQILDSVAKASEVGEGDRNARKSTSMKANKDVQAMKKATKSIIVGITLSDVLNTLAPEFDRKTFYDMAFELEATASEDWKRRLAQLCGITLPPKEASNVTVHDVLPKQLSDPDADAA